MIDSGCEEWLDAGQREDTRDALMVWWVRQVGAVGGEMVLGPGGVERQYNWDRTSPIKRENSV